MPRTDDPRSTADLIALIADDNPGADEWSDEADKAFITLHARATRDVWEAARNLCLSTHDQHRVAGVHILGELGTPRVFSDESCDVIVKVLQTSDELNVIRSAVFALGHLGNDRGTEALISFADHPDNTVRHGVAFALCGSTSVDVIPTLIVLMDDPYEMARDWATTTIGQTVAWDGPDIREALLNRTDDPDEITRYEALHGLTRRKDDRAIPYIIKELEKSGGRPHLFVDAAKEYLGINEDETVKPLDLLATLRTL